MLELQQIKEDGRFEISNYESLDKELDLQLAPFQNGKVIVVESDKEKSIVMAEPKNIDLTVITLDECKDLKAKLNNASKKFSDVRIAFEKELKEIKGIVQIKSLVGKMSDTSAYLDSFVKGFESKRVEEKQKDIESIFNACKSQLGLAIKLEVIFKSEWLNKGFKLDKIEEEIKAVFEKYQEDVKTIYTVFGNDQSSINLALDRFQQDLDVSKTITYVQNIKNVQKPKTDVSNESIKIYSANIKIYGTEKEINEVIHFMIENSIKYEKI